MKIFKYLNMLLLIISIVGTIILYDNLPREIILVMKSPNRIIFIGVVFAILLILAFVSIYPQKISRNKDIVRNEITLIVLNLLGIGIFLYYFAVIAKYKGFQIDYLKVIILIIGVLMMA